MMARQLISGTIDCAAMALLVVAAAGITWMVWY
jgi:hypothetical protein